MTGSTESGQALLLALVVLLLVSTTGALVVGAIALEQRQHQREVDGVRLRALLDAAVSTGLARLASAEGYRGHSERWEGGSLGIEVERKGAVTFEIEVLAAFRSRRAAGRARVERGADDEVRVIRWRRLRPEEVSPSLRRQIGPR